MLVEELDDGVEALGVVVVVVEDVEEVAELPLLPVVVLVDFAPAPEDAAPVVERDVRGEAATVEVVAVAAIAPTIAKVADALVTPATRRARRAGWRRPVSTRLGGEGAKPAVRSALLREGRSTRTVPLLTAE